MITVTQEMNRLLQLTCRCMCVFVIIFCNFYTCVHIPTFTVLPLFSQLLHSECFWVNLLDAAVDHLQASIWPGIYTWLQNTLLEKKDGFDSFCIEDKKHVFHELRKEACLPVWWIGGGFSATFCFEAHLFILRVLKKHSWRKKKSGTISSTEME